MEGKERETFRYALVVVSVAAVAVAGMFFYQAWPHTERWLIYGPVVAGTALLVFPLVYFSYKRGQKQPMARRASVLSATLSGLLAIGYVVTGIVDHKTGWDAFRIWVFSGLWLLAAVAHLRRAQQEKDRAQ